MDVNLNKNGGKVVLSLPVMRNCTAEAMLICWFIINITMKSVFDNVEEKHV